MFISVRRTDIRVIPDDPLFQGTSLKIPLSRNVLKAPSPTVEALLWIRVAGGNDPDPVIDLRFRRDHDPGTYVIFLRFLCLSRRFEHGGPQ